MQNVFITVVKIMQVYTIWYFNDMDINSDGSPANTMYNLQI